MHGTRISEVSIVLSINEMHDLLNAMKVTALFAVDAGKPVGIIHVHDLLRAGAA